MKRGDAAARIPDIMDAAFIEFAEKGYAAARMDDIAARVGVSKPIIYRHFPTKDALFKALMTRNSRTAFESTQKAVREYKGPLRPLLTAITQAVKAALPTPENRRDLALMVSAPQHMENVDEVVRRTIDPVRLDLTKQFAQAIKRGDMRKCDHRMAAKHFFAPSLQCAFRILALGLVEWKQFDMERYLDSALEAFCRAYDIP